LLPSNGYYHWLVEDLPLFLEMLRRVPNSKVLVYEKCPQYVKDFASTLAQDVISVPRFVNLKSTSIISKGPNTEWVHPSDVEILRSYFAKELSPRRGGTKVYVSREKSSRSPFFEKEIVHFLRNSGWKILFAEEMTLIDQIRTFSEAEVICGVHGAGLSGMIWMEEGSKVIELSPEKFIPCFARMSNVLNHKYLRIEIENVDLQGIDLLASGIEAFC
jgi:capsular polysaccharide biosynthesis protein